MTELIACLGEGPATQEHVRRVINGENWEKIFLITTESEDFKTGKETQFIAADTTKLLPELTQDLVSKLKDKVTGTEVALNLISGTGKLHMALLSALLKLGLGIRLVALTKEGIREI